MDDVILKVKELITGLLEPDSGHFLVDITVKPTHNIKVFIDGDQGVGIDDLVGYNRALYRRLEELALFPEGDFSLEVSSAGLDQPLRMLRQYQKNLNRFVELVLVDGTKKEGKLLEAGAEDILLEITTGKGKKAVVHTERIPMATIKSTYIQIKF
ncbi:hypothetical protein GCM10027051_03020 [Niabella terrae]